MSGLGNVARDVPAAGSASPVFRGRVSPSLPRVAPMVPTRVARDVGADVMSFSRFTGLQQGDGGYYPFFAECKFIMADVPRGVLRLADPTVSGVDRVRVYKHRGQDFERGVHALWALRMGDAEGQVLDWGPLEDYPVFPYLSPAVMLAAARWRCFFSEGGLGSLFSFTQAGPATGRRGVSSSVVWDEFWLPRLSEFLVHVSAVPKGFAGSPDLSLIDAMRYPSKGGQPGAWAEKARLAVDTFLGK